MDDKRLQIIMKLILNGGNAKSSAFEAITAAKKGDFVVANNKLREADDYLAKGHDVQTNILKTEADGKTEKISLLMIHAQDHIMNAITFRDLAGEIITLYSKLARKME